MLNENKCPFGENSKSERSHFPKSVTGIVIFIWLFHIVPKLQRYQNVKRNKHSSLCCCKIVNRIVQDLKYFRVSLPSHLTCIIMARKIYIWPVQCLREVLSYSHHC